MIPWADNLIVWFFFFLVCSTWPRWCNLMMSESKDCCMRDEFYYLLIVGGVFDGENTIIFYL